MRLAPAIAATFSLDSFALPARPVSTRLTLQDWLNAVVLRLGIGRNTAAIPTGLYCVGSPSPTSPILISANYRLSFDALRKELKGLDLWILVIDTKGINVWCAAGKGTFSAAEIQQRAALCKLELIAPQSPLILPQLAASGVDARALSQATGRRVVFGPVRAKDLAEFLRMGMKKNLAMSRVSFTLRERVVLAPLELVQSWPLYLASLAVAFCLAVPFGSGFETRFLMLLMWLEGAVIIGGLFVPILLPFLPGRYFSIKGAFLAMLWSAFNIFIFYTLQANSSELNFFALIAGTLLSIAFSSYIAMNFTGASTFTNQKGVEQEVSRSLPLIILAAATGSVLVIIHCAGTLFSGGIHP